MYCTEQFKIIIIIIIIFCCLDLLGDLHLLPHVLHDRHRTGLLIIAVVCVCMYVCLYVCMYVCMCTYHTFLVGVKSIHAIFVGVQYGISGELSDCLGVLPLHPAHRVGGPLRSPGAVSLPKEGIVQEGRVER